MKIQLGAHARDRITGFYGCVIGHARYITGCDQYLLTPREGEKDSKWFDEQRLLVDTDAEVFVIDNSNGNSADLPAPIK